MTAKDVKENLNSLSNAEKQKFLKEIYEEYFRTASDEQLYADSLILQKYYDGELVEVDGY